MRGATASAMGTGLGTALATAIVVVLTGAFVTVSDARDAAPVTLTFERVDRIGGHQTTILGSPRVVVTPIGTAVEFDGVDDALLMHVHPLAGWENRMLFEICVVDDFTRRDSRVGRCRRPSSCPFRRLGVVRLVDWTIGSIRAVGGDHNVRSQTQAPHRRSTSRNRASASSSASSIRTAGGSPRTARRRQGARGSATTAGGRLKTTGPCGSMSSRCGYGRVSRGRRRRPAFSDLSGGRCSSESACPSSHSSGRFKPCASLERPGGGCCAAAPVMTGATGQDL